MGDNPPKNFLGLKLCETTICSTPSSSILRGSVFRGRYRLKRPFVFSSPPFCQEAYTSQKYVGIFIVLLSSWWRANSLPLSNVIDLTRFFGKNLKECRNVLIVSIFDFKRKVAVYRVFRSCNTKRCCLFPLHQIPWPVTDFFSVENMLRPFMDRGRILNLGSIGPLSSSLSTMVLKQKLIKLSFEAVRKAINR